MKKLFLALTIVSLCLSSCRGQASTNMKSLDGVEYPAIFVDSGYYFDKATRSDANLTFLMSNVKQVEKPSNLGSVDLPDFSKITLYNNPKEEITAATIEAEIEAERDKYVSYTPIKSKRAAALGDRITMDFKCYAPNSTEPIFDEKDYALILRDGEFVPGFIENVVGRMAGRSFSFEIIFPEGYIEDLTGKSVKFEGTIKLIEESETPVFNEEFVAKNTRKNSTTIEQYKDELKERIEKRNEFMNNRNLAFQIYEKLMSESKFYPTEEAFAWQFSVMLNNYNQSAISNGVTLGEMIESYKLSPKEFYDQLKSILPDTIQETMMFDVIEKKYKVSVTNEEIRNSVETELNILGYDPSISIDDYLQEVTLEAAELRLKQEKALLEIVKLCNVEDEVEEQ